MWWRRLRYVVLLTALCAIATCPAAKRACTANSRAREAEQLLGYLADRVAYVLVATGKVPPTAAGPTPEAGCCDQEGGACAADPGRWTTAGWQALTFSIDGEHRYAYSYLPGADGTSAVVRAVGDLDCDGDLATFEIELRAEGNRVRRSVRQVHPRE